MSEIFKTLFARKSSSLNKINQDRKIEIEFIQDNAFVGVKPHPSLESRIKLFGAAVKLGIDCVVLGKSRRVRTTICQQIAKQSEKNFIIFDIAELTTIEEIAKAVVDK